MICLFAGLEIIVQVLFWVNARVSLFMVAIYFSRSGPLSALTTEMVVALFRT